jgi:Na+/H+ antiporter NhaD/arsenite permease-like protein
MEWFDWIRDKLNIDPAIVFLVLLSGFFAKKYMIGWVWNKHNVKYDVSLKTLAVSFVFSSIYILIAAKELKRATMDGSIALIPWGKFFFSFAITISIYDYAIKPFIKWLNKKTGNTDPETPTSN